MIFYHGVSITISNKHLQGHVYTNKLGNAFDSGEIFASYFFICEDCQRRLETPLTHFYSLPRLLR